LTAALVAGGQTTVITAVQGPRNLLCAVANPLNGGTTGGAPANR
jgi:hypothetical protein